MSFSNLEILQVEQALTHSISMDQTQREESHKFLSRECEPNPLFQLALL
jgi:DNA-directed RNA polymerase specialized sigma54-like protein